MQTGQVAQSAGLSIDTIRFYEKQALMKGRALRYIARGNFRLLMIGETLDI
jgi:DNA-binding transcriptional MerR regulator